MSELGDLFRLLGYYCYYQLIFEKDSRVVLGALFGPPYRVTHD
jgi:hypothetical protein